MFGANIFDYGSVGMMLAFAIYAAILILQQFGVITPSWHKKINTIHRQCDEIYPLLKKDDANAPPQWYCRCYRDKQVPNWDLIKEIRVELVNLQHSISKLERSDMETAESLKSVYKNLTDLISGLVKQLGKS